MVVSEDGVKVESSGGWRKRSDRGKGNEFIADIIRLLNNQIAR